MQSKDKILMDNILKAVDEFYGKYYRTPTIRELGEICGTSHITISRYLRQMSEMGMLEYNDGNITTEKMSKSKPECVSVPILGSISCGMLLEEEGNVESYVRLPVELVGRGEFICLKANGDSMIDAGIDDGDYVLINKTTEACDGDIVVALVDNENTLKRFYRDEKRRKVILHPENKSYDDIVVNSCEIQGVAVMVLKDLRKKL
ncbi:MAG: repressor LexA [Clostridiales bacterium]|nr:repressor LexA [Clostridiales bacterium]